MSTNNSPWKGVVGSKWKNVGVVEEKPDEAATRRRSSSSAQKYNGLMNQKRNSTDAAAAARKASFAEQSKAPGFLGGLWHKSDALPSRRPSLIAYRFVQFHQGRRQISEEAVDSFLLSPYTPEFRTFGVQNIEKRFTAGGGAPNHTPGQATKLGSHTDVTGNQLNHKGVGTPQHEEKIAEQRPEVSFHTFSGERNWQEYGLRGYRAVVGV
ncbi:MAG: hypothetical protein Q9207_000552 [Kuettlingeria erythrocarpa]